MKITAPLTREQNYFVIYEPSIKDIYCAIGFTVRACNRSEARRKANRELSKSRESGTFFLTGVRMVIDETELDLPAETLIREIFKV